MAQRLLARAVAGMRAPAGVSVESVAANGVRCEWIDPHGPHSARVLVYIHGGGFVMGLTPAHIRMAAYLARKAGIRVLMVDYRLAPAHPFPAALEDCVAAYRWVLKQGLGGKSVAIAGDSAGGNLTITTMMKIRDLGEPLPAAAACLSPVACLVPGSNRLEGMEDPVLPSKAIEYYNRSYVGTSDASNPLISPLFGDLRDLPPLLMHVGECEVLRDNAVRLAASAKAAGVDARWEIFPGMWHVWQLFPKLPQASRSLDGIAAFLGERLRETAPN
jgi:acetyl esterase/lipase